MNAYAPHSRKEYELRKDLLDSVGKAWTQHGKHNCTIALGDFNARMGKNYLEKMM